MNFIFSKDMLFCFPEKTPWFGWAFKNTMLELSDIFYLPLCSKGRLSGNFSFFNVLVYFVY